MKNLIRIFVLSVFAFSVMSCASDDQEKMVFVDDAHEILQDAFDFDDLQTFEVTNEGATLEMTGVKVQFSLFFKR